MAENTICYLTVHTKLVCFSALDLLANIKVSTVNILINRL